MTRPDTRRPDARQPRRRGLTFIELLVVIAIISILLSLVTFASVRFITTSRAAATRVTILKAASILDGRRRAMGRIFADGRGGTTSPAGRIFSDRGINFTSGFDQGRVTPLGVKVATQAFFPVGLNEIDSPVASNPPYNVTNLGAGSLRTSFDVGSQGSDTLDNPELLYFLLTDGEAFGQDEVPSDFTASEVRDLDSDGRPELVDSWGNPLRFYRWPTSLTGSPPRLPDGSVGEVDANSNDIADPSEDVTGNGKLDTQPLVAAAALRILPSPPGTSDPDNPLLELGAANGLHADTYHTFLIVSAGPDGVLGLSEPCVSTRIDDSSSQTAPGLAAVVDAEAVFDNISNLNAEAGGRIE